MSGLRTGLVAVLLSIPSPGAGGIPGPVIVEQGSDHVLSIPTDMLGAIQKAVPGLRVWTLAAYDPDIRLYYRFTSRQAPWAVIGDFNGDGVPDLIVDGRSPQRCYRLCVWGDASAPRVDILSTRACGPRDAPSSAVLMYVAPGEHGTNFSDDSVFLYTDAYLHYFWEKAGSTWYWRGGKWNEFVSAD